MKATAKVWQLSLLAAVVLHLLALAGWQLARRRQPTHEWLRAADDTPMLLQFSREEALAPEAGGIPLPPATALPPPIGGAAATTLPGQGSGPGKRGALPPTAAKAERKPQRKAGAKGSAASPSARQERPRPGARPGAPSPAAAHPLALGAGSPAREALERGLHDARPASPEEATEPARNEKAAPRGADGSAGPETETRSSGGDPARPGALGSLLGANPADRRLWSLARPSRPAPGSLEGLPAGLTVRELPLGEARGSGAEIRHRRLVRLDDGVLLLWVDGSTLWLVRTPLL